MVEWAKLILENPDDVLTVGVATGTTKFRVTLVKGSQIATLPEIKIVLCSFSL
jgi:hypothetical protein